MAINIRKFAAIDIGSNAVRLLVQNVIERKGKLVQFKKSELIRVPIRLGEDAFVLGEISENNQTRMVKAMQSFKLLMDVYGVENYWACATSAMREANNGLEVVDKIKQETGVSIDIIDGKIEAKIIASTDLKELLQKGKTYLYVDVGGGSTEFTVFNGDQVVVSKSFKIGTVRLLNDQVKESVWEGVKSWVKEHLSTKENVEIIGSGGNINKLHKMSGRKIGQPLSYIWLNAQYHFLDAMSYDDRVSELGLNQDRADVIVPATKIFLNTAKWSGAKKIHVPKIGLSDGMIKTLYKRETSHA